MLETAWQEFSQGLGRRWLATTFLPVFVFWLALLFVIVQPQGISQIGNVWATLDDYERFGIVLAGLAVTTLTAVLLDVFQPLLIKTYEGYWSGPILGWLRNRMSDRARERIRRHRDQFNVLAQKVVKSEASKSEIRRYYELEQALGYWPSRTENILPTRLGNVLRSAEDYAYTRYGLDAVTAWPRLYFQLAHPIKEALSLVYSNMGALLKIAALALVFGLICIPYCIWYHLWLWAALFTPSFLLSALCYQGAIQLAQQYGLIVRTSFDLQRFDLYQALHWPLPISLSEETPSTQQQKLGLGQKLSLFLHRGQYITDIVYSHHENERPPSESAVPSETDN